MFNIGDRVKIQMTSANANWYVDSFVLDAKSKTIGTIRDIMHGNFYVYGNFPSGNKFWKCSSSEIILYKKLPKNYKENVEGGNV